MSARSPPKLSASEGFAPDPPTRGSTTLDWGTAPDSRYAPALVIALLSNHGDYYYYYYYVV